MKLILESLFLLLGACMPVLSAAPGSPIKMDITGNLQIRVSVPLPSGHMLEQSFEVPELKTIAVRNEEHHDFPIYDQSKVWFATGTSPKRSIFNEVVPGSMKVRAGKDEKSRLYAEGKDYIFSVKDNRIGKTPDSGIGKTPVYLSYDLNPQRIDSIVRKEDKLLYREGAPAGIMPLQPELDPGEVRIANLYLPTGTKTLSGENCYPISDREFTETSPVAEELLPKTMQKLRRGEPLRILAWGDSVTEGYGAIRYADRWQEQFVAKLKQRFPQAQIELATNGWGGHNTLSFMAAPEKDKRHHYESAILGVRPDLVISLFVNDSWHGEKEFNSIYPRILNDFRKAGTEWIVMTPHHIAGMANKDGDDSREYVKLLRQFARENRVALADVSDRYSRLYRQGIPWLTLMVNHYNHPDSRGMKIYADALMELFPEK